MLMALSPTLTATSPAVAVCPESLDVWEALLGKLLGWIPAPWFGVRLKHKVIAHMCTSGHPLMLFAGDPGRQASFTST